MLSINKSAGMFVLPDFKQIQIESFRYFLTDLLPLELERFGVIKNSNQQLEFKLLGESYRLEVPKFNEREAVYQSATYASNLYAPAYLSDLKHGTIQRQTVFLGSLPLMSATGTFVIRGISRCIVSQLLRSPGIYYTLNVQAIYTATIIGNSGKSFKIELDRQGYLWIRVGRNSKAPLLLLLSALGLKMHCIPQMIKQRTKKLDKLSLCVEDAKIELCKRLKLKQKTTQIELGITDPIYSLFLKPYELGLMGRFNLNKRLNLRVSESETLLRSQDLIVASEYLVQVSNEIGYLDDIDDLKHKRVKWVSDLFSVQLNISLKKLNVAVHVNLHKMETRACRMSLKSIVSSNALATTLFRFVASYQLSQFLDQTNPLSEIVHKRKLSLLGPGGLTPRTARFRVRDIHPSQYGRICPVQTAEGQNAGVVNSFTICAQIGNRGAIKTTLYKVHTNSMQGHIINMLPGEDEYTTIATESCLTVADSLHQVQSIPAQHRREFVTLRWDEIEFRNTLPLHSFSVGVVLIPFLEHDDATRALMGSNMQRQAVPLLKPQNPLVGTGIESQVALDSGTVITSMHECKIHHVDATQIAYVPQNSIEIKYIHLINYERSNNGTCLHQKPIVKCGQTIRKGQLIADGSATLGGELALGKNVLVAYMPWEGYNFEDAVLINERLIYEDVYTSLHIERYEAEARESNQATETITKQIPHLNAHVLRHLDENGVVCVGSWVNTGDVLIGKLTAKQSEGFLHTPESKLLQDILGVQAFATQDSCLKVPPRGEGRVIDVRWVARENHLLGHRKVVHVYILQERKIQVGDKVAGRHGNKGVVSRILSRQDMPYLQDGTPVDMVLSPLGVPSRMNVGQVFECLLGLAGGYLNKHYRIMPFDERYGRESSRKLVFSELHKARHSANFPWLFEPDSPGKTRLFDGRTGEVFNQPVTVGRAYMFKLIHQVDDKIHARSTGPYALVTQQPVRGRSRQGGQRVGEMEVWAFQGFGAACILQELLTTKSDHATARAEAPNAIVTGNLVPKPTTTSDCLRVLIRELRCLGIELDHTTLSQHNMRQQISET
uniref:DNA-directed RNA polymerase subunit beta n=1 Tax=Zygnema circumcarinatum TaxID=35869 RepID=A0A6N0GXD1_ZYGCR|nr:beta subunit of RNA polymerase [Zygnema circumcarinatum]